jgi:hypothetical protein
MAFIDIIFKKQNDSVIQALFAVLFLILLCYSPVRVAAQMQFYRQHNSDSIANTHLHDTIVKKRFGRGTVLWGLAEVTPWAFDRYVTKEDYVNTSLNTIGNNINPRNWAWDNDPFTTNQLGHPAHGSVFFNAYRSNGYNFWQSVPATLVGSFLWEAAAEKQAFAPNDFINTSFGGTVLGEMTHRLSNVIINNHTRGFKRQASEVIALIINPANGLNRIIDGKWGKVAPNSTERDSSKIYAEFDLGMRRFKVNNRDGNFGWYGHIKILYGTPYEDYKTPFSYIYINTVFGKDDSTSVNNVNVAGSLNGWRVGSTDNSRHLALLTANYDYISNQAFKYSAESLKLNLISEFQPSNKIRINTTVGIGPIILAAVPDAYLYNGRPYDYCTGGGLNASGEISIGNKLFYGITYRGAVFKTVSGNSSDYVLQTVSSEARFMIIDGFSICAEPGYFSLLGNYKGNHVTKTYPYLRASVRYSLNIQ